MATITIRLPSILKEGFAKHCDDRGVTVTDALLVAIQRLVDGLDDLAEAKRQDNRSRPTVTVPDATWDTVNAETAPPVRARQVLTLNAQPKPIGWAANGSPVYAQPRGAKRAKT